MKWKTGKEEKTYILIGVLKAEKETNGTELIFKTIIQEQFPEANEDMNLHTERVQWAPEKRGL